ncbi:hypothetical protein AVEN_180707-1 [Araneus ventricosus]|uniref:Reverse transcriptase domain-containing protein n=1 Tax=Araneus ventricosus TaxID=182803 RepID=A0A4Y2FZ94_ARAVE|nr:hypothetical protein AVEN_180707-1 [Araneus ventricosus]
MPQAKGVWGLGSCGISTLQFQVGHLSQVIEKVSIAEELVNSFPPGGDSYEQIEDIVNNCSDLEYSDSEGSYSIESKRETESDISADEDDNFSNDCGNDVEIQLDTGACISVMSVRQFCKVSSQNKIERGNVILRPFGGELIKPVFEATVEVKYKDQHRTLDQIFKDIPGVDIYLDDIKIAGPKAEVRDERLSEVLKRLQHHGWHVNLNKCKIWFLKLNPVVI